MVSKSDQIRALREAKAESLANRPVINNAAAVINTEAQRQAKWRTANLELNRQRARDGMRKRRAKNNG